jgi:hypothetical protein
MDVLRRLFGGSKSSESPTDEPQPAATDQELDQDERAYERELAEFERHRTDDLRARQERYADRAWTPPAQGGERRAGDEGPGEAS